MKERSLADAEETASDEAVQAAKEPLALYGIETEPAFANGILNAVYRKAIRLAGPNAADQLPFAGEIAQAVLKAWDKRDPGKNWRGLAMQAIEWAAMKIYERKVLPARERNEHECLMLDCAVDAGDSGSESVEAQFSNEDGITDAAALRNTPAIHELKQAVRSIIAGLAPDEQALCQAALEGCSVREIESRTGIPHSSVAARLAALAPAFERLREMLPRKNSRVPDRPPSSR